jgi:nicotinamidase/pyrazinamidase
MKRDFAMRALVLVDIQNDFLPKGALAVPRGDEVVEVANRLMDHFDLVVATQDWHPADHGSFTSQHENGSVGDVVELNGLPQLIWPDHCVQNTSGAAFAAGLRVDRIQRVFPKGTDPGIDSYSGFYDNGRRKSTGLGEYLKDHGVDDVWVAGLATDYCVKATALDSLREGFKTRVVLDGVRGVDVKPGDVDAALRELRDAGVELVYSADVMNPAACPIETLAETKFLRLLRRGKWDYVQRTGRRTAVALVATTDDERVVLVEQHRIPVDASVIELPAGLAGDLPGEEDEPLETAARRELLEETGYEAGQLTRLVCVVSSAGLTDEAVMLLRARDVRQVGPGGGDGSEQIVVHAVPLAEIDEWLDERIAAGQPIDGRVFAALYFIRRNE